MMKVQVADSWQTQLRRRFECNLQNMATCTQQLHLYCHLLQETDYCLFLTDDPGDFADKEIFYIVDWFSRHLLGQIPLPLVDISAGSRHGHEEWKFWKWLASKQLLQSVDHKYRRRESSTVLTSLLTINTTDEKAALSWPDLAWEVAGRMQSHPKSWIPHLSEAAALTVGCPLQPEEGLASILSQLPGKQPSVWKTGHHLQENDTVLLFLLILIEWSTAYSIINNNHYHSGLNSYLLWFYHHLSQYQTGYRQQSRNPLLILN